MSVFLQGYPSSYMLAGLIGIFFFLGIIIVAIFYLLTLQNTLKAISPQNRRMEPGAVWFMLIPVFNIIWSFIVVIRIDESAKAEFEQKDPDTLPETAKDLGLTMCVLSCLTWIPLVGGIIWCVALICWIVYWTKMGALKRSLQALPSVYESDSQIFGKRH
jgi:hypothetical protein